MAIWMLPVHFLAVFVCPGVGARHRYCTARDHAQREHDEDETDAGLGVNAQCLFRIARHVAADW